MAETATTEKTTGTLGRRRLRRDAKKKLMAKIHGDKEFAKTYFGAKSKRSTDKKSAFRKKKSKKK